jgi:hypothetical protein
MEPMIDLSKIIDNFLGEAVSRCREEDQGQDDKVIDSLRDKRQDIEVRRKNVVDWLRHYSVLQGLNNQEREGVASAILEFADDVRRPAVCPRQEAEIIRLFNDLHDRCGLQVQKRKDGEPRNLVSLTSKALWCCYPFTIPLFDSYAQRSVWSISRLMCSDQPAGKNDDMPYNRFVTVWLDLYRRVESLIDDSLLSRYPYKVRVFDKILWIIGQPEYGTIPYIPYNLYNPKPEA